MTQSFKGLLLAGASAMTLLATVPIANAATYNIDFTTIPLYTPVTNQFPDVVFSLEGGPGDSSLPPVTGSFGTYSVGNSPTGEYPTTAILDLAFTTPVRNLSFTFDNFGDNGVSYFSASNGAFGNISALCCAFDLVNVPGGGITNLVISNGTGGSYNWEFGVQQVSFTTVPEPATWVLMMSGFGGFALLGYLRRDRYAAKAA
jgi:hypothetical protein